MDPTDEHTRDLLPYYDCNQSYLVCRPGRRETPDQRDRAAGRPHDGHQDHRGLDRRRFAGGEVRHCISAGVNDDAYRNAFSHMKPDDQRRFFERNLKGALPAPG